MTSRMRIGPEPPNSLVSRAAKDQSKYPVTSFGGNQYLVRCHHDTTLHHLLGLAERGSEGDPPCQLGPIAGRTIFSLKMLAIEGKFLCAGIGTVSQFAPAACP
jgi:hypothetical protein